MTTLVFSHGNGFPGGTYGVLHQHWRDAGFTVHAVDRFGHDPAFPVASNWRALRDELLAFIDRVSPDEPVVLVGHSLGGGLSLLAACRAPQRVQALVMLDSPVITGWRAHSIRLAKHTGLIERVSPGKVAQRRRQHWPDREAVHAHFRGKPVFAAWDERVLRDYVQAGFEDADGQVRLRFAREVETRIYNTLPHHMPALLRRHPPRCPVAFVAGTRSAEMRQAGLAGSRALAGERFVSFEGTHLYPMERPDDTARLVLQLLDGMGVKP
jgi:pimeloyl-ACP methyl ester carboxylesterase